MIKYPVENVHVLSVEEILTSFQTDSEKGISSTEADERTKKFGSNTFQAQKQKSIWLMLLQQFKSPIVYLLVVGAAVSFYFKDYIFTIFCNGCSITSWHYFFISSFWILNNGINAVCEHFEVKGDQLTIKNFQIVNGGQTTKTLTRIVNDLPDEVQILMRLTKIQDKTRTSKISMDIAVASNSQNAISARDLHSGDRIQNKIYSNLDTVGIFYDKKDGEWATVNKKKYRNPATNAAHDQIRAPLISSTVQTAPGKRYR